MEPQISLITLGVADLERSWRFYHEGLGLPTTWGPGHGVIFFKTTGTVLALYPHDKLAEDATLAPGSFPRPFTGIALAHNVRDQAEVDQLLARAAAAGGQIVKPGQATFWGGYAGYFADPDGYLWEVAHGGFALDEAGHVILTDPKEG